MTGVILSALLINFLVWNAAMVTKGISKVTGIRPKWIFQIMVFVFVFGTFWVGTRYLLVGGFRWQH